MRRLNKYLLIFLLLFLMSQYLSAQSNQPYFYYPKSYSPFHYSFVVGMSLTKLPVDLVEDEINTAPMLKFDSKLGVFDRVDFSFLFYSNYIANLGAVGFQWMICDGSLSIAIGEKTSIWFGHLEFDAIELKSMGVVVAPNLSIGYKTDLFTVTTIIESHSSYMKTLSNDILLREFIRPFSAYTVNFVIEQPLWNDNWVALGIKFNYAKFYYQSWLTYSTIDEFFFYPEFTFGFIL